MTDVLRLDVYDEADPNGTPLVSLSDEDVESFSMRKAENELGSGEFTIRRDHEAVEFLLGGSHVKVTIPVISGDPIFSFWLSQQGATILASNEEGGEVLKYTGLGTLAILGNAMLLDDFYNGPLGGADRGNTSEAGYWTWTSEPYGAILVRLIEEGQYEPGEPLADVTIDFTRTLDSEGNDWPDIEETIQVDIGTDGLELYSRLVASGNLYVRADPDLSIHGYGSAPGSTKGDLAFGTGIVRFEKGINVETELGRNADSRPANRALVRGKDTTYRQVGFGGARGKWIAVDYPESNDPDLLDAVGQQELARQGLLTDQIVFEFTPGINEDAGFYLPFLHFDIGDSVRLHTGDGLSDYNEIDTRVLGILIELDSASKDDTTLEAARSLHFTLECNGTPNSGALGTSARATNTCGCPCDTGSPVLDSDPPAYKGEMYLGGYDIPGDEPSSYVRFRDGTSTIEMAYVRETAIVFTGDVADGIFIPDGNCWPAVQSVPTAGLVGWQGASVAGIWGTATAARVYARVSCDPWAPE